MGTLFATIGAVVAALTLSGAAAFTVVELQSSSAPANTPDAPAAVQYGAN